MRLFQQLAFVGWMLLLGYSAQTAAFAIHQSAHASERSHRASVSTIVSDTGCEFCATVEAPTRVSLLKTTIRRVTTCELFEPFLASIEQDRRPLALCHSRAPPR